MSVEKPLKLIPRQATEIRIAIIGMGKMGHFHLQSLQQLAAGAFEEYYKGNAQQQLNKIRVVAVADIDHRRMQSLTQIPCFTDSNEMLQRCRPHIVIIASPTPTHYDFARLALENGIHTFVEKPLVTSKQQIDTLAALANTSGCRLMSGHVERYNPVSITIRSLLSENRIHPVSYAFTRMQKHDERIAEDIVVDKVIHDLDLALYFFGEITAAHLQEAKRVNGKVFQARVELNHVKGISGTILTSWLVESQEKTRIVRIKGQNHMLEGDFFQKRLRMDGREIECKVPGWIKPDSNQIKDELVDFIAYCSEPATNTRSVEPLLSIEEIVQSIDRIDSLIRQTEQG